MRGIILQAKSRSFTESEIIFYIVGFVVLFFIIRSFLRNPSQFIKAVMIRVVLVVGSIFYFFWKQDLVDDSIGLFGMLDDIGIPIFVWRYIIRKQYPFPSSKNQNNDTGPDTKKDDVS